MAMEKQDVARSRVVPGHHVENVIIASKAKEIVNK